jgi:ribosomal protein L21
MYAVIATGGKQYKVTKGETLRVEKLDGDEGSTVKLDKVLMVADGDKVSVGTPTLAVSIRAPRPGTVKVILKSKLPISRHRF